MDGHALAALVLAHVQRFFAAARRAADGARDTEMSSLLTLGGNLLWAHSAHVGAPKEQERAMAVVGAAAGSMASALSSADESTAERAFDELESALLVGLDPLVERLAAKLRAEGPAEGSPATVARWVWEQLFPQYPWGLGQSALEAAIRARLAR